MRQRILTNIDLLEIMLKNICFFNSLQMLNGVVIYVEKYILNSYFDLLSRKNYFFVELNI